MGQRQLLLHRQHRTGAGQPPQSAPVPRQLQKRHAVLHRQQLHHPDAALSPYKDRTLGASVNFSTTAFQNQLLQFGYQYKTDRHHDQEKETRFRDAAHQFALEHQIDFTPQWRLRSSADYEHLAAKELPAGYQKGKTHSVNGLIELSYRPVENQMFYATVSGKSSFPSIKDRYSFRMGRALPNPDLKSERARHIELGWKGQPWQGAQAEAAVFYSRLSNEIQNALVPEPTRNACRRSGTRSYCNQAQNIGRTRHTGAEISLRQNIGSQWTLGLS
ncbi:TonB-dependent receptor domain-containing protein [Neisseria bacilliformis]|uniref:TonB-dependent receptor plug domain-containing protein n=1 Tax=Neisseria bacilliformis TaxID=267212 RepID=UPI0036F3D058